jgi:hypothetical protein
MSPFTSTFFSNTTGYTSEVNLFDDLVREQIKLFGVDVLYMPRRMLNLDKLLHEATKNSFELALPIPAYIKTFDGYDNGLEALSKFGIRSSDELTLQVSRSEFVTHYSPFLKSYYNGIAGREDTSVLNHLEGETATRPKEGDLIYFPFDDGIFEIKYVNFDQPFFQLGQGYVFELQCEKFEYSGEEFETGYDQVDDTTIQPDYFRLEFKLDEGGKNTFLNSEKVIIYNLEDYEITDGGEVELIEFIDIIDGGTATIENEDEVPVYSGNAGDIEFESAKIPFRLHKDPGYVNAVVTVEGTVQYWNQPLGKLTLSDLHDLDPTQDDEEKDLTINKFDKVVIVGQTSGAIWYSSQAYTADKAFDDEKIIQEEFDMIKIVDDPFDENPFGFV